MKMMGRVLPFVAALLAVSAAHAQSVPVQLSFGQVPTPGQWALAFSAKQDVLGYTPLNSAGGTMLGKLWLAPSASFQSGLNLGVGVAPSTPRNGDLWVTGAGLYAQVNGATVGPFLATTLGPLAMLTPGANVAAALAVALNAQNGVPSVYSSSFTTGDCLKWGPGIQDAGSACGASGAGNVSSAGTPVNGQLAQWTGAGTIQGIAAGTGVVSALANNLNSAGGLLGFSALGTNVYAALGGILNEGSGLVGVNYFGTNVFAALGNNLSATGGVVGVNSLGTGVLSALETTLNAAGGVPGVNGTIPNGDCLMWSATGVQDFGGACGAVTSFNTRVGPVVAAAGDYTTAQLTTATGAAPAGGLLGHSVSTLPLVATPLTASAASYASFSLSAGDYLCWADIEIAEGATARGFNAWITSNGSYQNSDPGFPNFGGYAAATAGVMAANATTTYEIGPQIVRVTTTTTFYLSGFASSATNGPTIAGYMACQITN